MNAMSSGQFRLFLCLAFILPLCGCIGATRLPVRAVSPGGNKIEPKEIDLNFIRVGSTQRDEVDHQLSMIDTAYDNPRVFWGRWSESRWGYWWIAGVPCDNCMTGDGHRLWRIKNLLVTFGENGTVSSTQTVDDNKIWTTLRTRIAEIHPPTLDVTQPIRITLTSPDPVAIQMNSESMEFERPPESRKPNVRVQVADLMRFRHKSLADSDPFSSVTCHTLELAQKSTFGKKINFCAEANQMGVLVEYLQQAAPTSMAWR